MIVASSLHDLGERCQLQRAAVACGVFDGVHRGHQKILQKLVKLAAQKEALPVVLTFSPHPRAVLGSQEPPPLLTERNRQLEIFADLGVAATVIVKFTSAVAGMHPRHFMERYLFSDNVELAGVCVGATWRFGARGLGDTAFLEKIGRQYSFPVASVPEFTWYGQPLSSTRIRQKIQSGQVRTAHRMLGRPHAVRGRVLHGRGIGASDFHCPTANLQAAHVLHPPPGVYAARFILDSDLPPPVRAKQEGVVYVGTAPTLKNGSRPGMFIECHIFDFHEALYERELEVQFIEHIRPDHIFADKQSLAAQIKCDIAQARRILIR